MSEAIGRVSCERSRQPMFLPESFSNGNVYSEANAARFDDEVARFVDETHQRVRKILSERHTVLDALAHLRSRQERDQGDEFRITLSSAAPPLAA